MRLIDADALKEYFEKCLKVDSGKDDTKERYAYMAWLRGVHAIDNAPTVDVVRCKDCSFAKPTNTENVIQCTWLSGYRFRVDHFCSCGEKMEV